MLALTSSPTALHDDIPAPLPIPDSSLPIALDSSNPLRDKLEKAGRIEPGQDAHHKVPQGGKQNDGRDPHEEQDKLAKLGIDLHAVENWVGLSSEFHRKLHTRAYYDMIKARFFRVTTDTQARMILRDLESRLQKADRAYQKHGTPPSWRRTRP